MKNILRRCSAHLSQNCASVLLILNLERFRVVNAAVRTALSETAGADQTETHYNGNDYETMNRKTVGGLRFGAAHHFV